MRTRGRVHEAVSPSISVGREHGGTKNFFRDYGMPDEKTFPYRVRARRVDTRCGLLGHMTVDEIRERIIGDQINVTCPECGEIHLTVEDAEGAAARKVRNSARFKKLLEETGDKDIF